METSGRMDATGGGATERGSLCLYTFAAEWAHSTLSMMTALLLTLR
ncbi:MAG: hypothetical protein WA734_01590 [Candidatus Acidiferrales bacterium]